MQARRGIQVSFSSARVRIIQTGNIRMGVNAAGSGIRFPSALRMEDHSPVVQRRMHPNEPALFRGAM